MNRFRWLAAGAAIVAATPAVAGDEPLYRPAPDWVAPAELDVKQAGKGPSQLLYDWQHRIEGGVAYSYEDRAVRIDNPQALMDENTLQLAWLPDKGDLTVHRVEIIRDGKVIDLVDEGRRFDVLRREQGLEYRLLDGELTATMSVPGLRVGDVLRVTHSTSLADQALGDEVQVTQYLETKPWQVGKARAIVSWPNGAEMFWGAEPWVGLAEPELRDGYRYLTVELPLAEPPDMPRDAPSRYRRPAVLRVGSFADWAELSTVLAPHYTAAVGLAEDSAVAAEAARIMQATDDPLERAARAVRLVQDEISYLLDGLDGGNYLPQSADETWAKRYGDCKAKSVLLVALLREMGIDAEPMVVASSGGDAVPELLPLPAAFDHMIARARIGGTDYWLDGTSSGTRLANIGDVPPFHYALPIRESGADLVAMPQRDKQQPDMDMAVTMDHTAGVDLPYLFEAEMRVFGPQGASVRALADEQNPDFLRRAASSFGRSSGMSGGRVSSIEIAYDEEAGEGIVKLAGIANSEFEWEDGRLVMDAGEGMDDAGFNPDRAKPEWREIPVATPGPAFSRMSSRIVLPEDAEGFSLVGPRVIEGGYGNLKAKMNVALEGGALVAEAQVRQALGEIAPADLPEAKLAARRLANTQLKLLAPEDVEWRWEIDQKVLRRRVEPLVAAYEAAMDFAEEDDYGPLADKARLLVDVYDYEAALADYDVLVEKALSANVLWARAGVLDALGRRADAIADLERAYELDPQTGTAFHLARLLAYEGRAEAGLELLESLPVSENERIDYADAWATIAGLRGDTDSGLRLLAEEVAVKPQNSSVLNSSCWFRGLFNVALDEALAECTRAVERASDPVAALDSRAMVKYRLGDYDSAIADLDSVLAVAPHVAASRYLRGIVRLDNGDKAGREDIEIALRMSPQLAEIYARHGVAPKR